MGLRCCRSEGSHTCNVKAAILIKPPARDACLYTRRNSRGRGCQLPHFLLAIAQQPLGGFSSNLAHVCSSHRAICLNMVSQHFD